MYMYYIIVEGQRDDDKSEEFAASLGLLKFLICQLVSRGAVCTAAAKSREQRLGWAACGGDGDIYCLLKGVLCCYTAVK